MKRTSIRYRLMILMICLTTLPVLTVTWIATNNTRNSVEKEMIEANRSRMLWADQYLDELIRQIDVLFYSLQVNQQLIEGLNTIDSQDLGGQFRTQRYIQETLTTAFYGNSKKIDELALYTHQNQKVYSVNYANSGLIYSLDIQKGNWTRLLQKPVNMYFKESGNGIYAYTLDMRLQMGNHGSIAVFLNGVLLGTSAMKRNDWQTVRLPGKFQAKEGINRLVLMAADLPASIQWLRIAPV